MIDCSFIHIDNDWKDDYSLLIKDAGQEVVGSQTLSCGGVKEGSVIRVVSTVMYDPHPNFYFEKIGRIYEKYNTFFNSHSRFSTTRANFISSRNDFMTEIERFCVEFSEYAKKNKWW